MNQDELQNFEKELRRLAPARPPEELMAQLSARLNLNRRDAKSAETASSAFIVPLRFDTWIARLLRWAMPVGAVAAVLVVLSWVLPSHTKGVHSVFSAMTPAVKADDVQIDHELVSTFDAVAQLPSGEPVRFRCREWMDQVVLSDKHRGITIEERTPRVEIVPVRFDTD